ncbi:MAG TPA: tryptophan synthase subunit alpha [Bacteroidales bacterium]|jgi:tryptophan synthase alpha chain|nr:tryptophan synthase subunit alpha [Bacteroidales bacterium]
MNRIEVLFTAKKKNILSVYFTAGFPHLDSVEEIILSLEKNGADMIETGIPFSDPLADGPVIQETSRTALGNGMSISNLFSQIRNIREKTNIPLLLMGYLNPVLQYGFEKFCHEASLCGIDGLIIPDLPMDEFIRDYKEISLRHGITNIFLVTPDTSEERIREIDNNSSGFIYMVSSASTTGKTNEFSERHISYFRKIAELKLQNPVLAGFGIFNRKTREQASAHVNGVIIGSAYVKALSDGRSIEEATKNFFRSLL